MIVNLICTSEKDDRSQMATKNYRNDNIRSKNQRTSTKDLKGRYGGCASFEGFGGAHGLTQRRMESGRRKGYTCKIMGSFLCSEVITAAANSIKKGNFKDTNFISSMDLLMTINNEMGQCLDDASGNLENVFGKRYMYCPDLKYAVHVTYYCYW